MLTQLYFGLRSAFLYFAIATRAQSLQSLRKGIRRHNPTAERTAALCELPVEFRERFLALFEHSCLGSTSLLESGFATEGDLQYLELLVSSSLSSANCGLSKGDT